MNAHDGVERPLAPHAPSRIVSDEEMLFPPLGSVMWRYRRAIGFGLVGVAAAYLVVVGLAWLFLPTEQLATITFRVEMQGAAQGAYPNGAKFSPDEIIATPVLARVYEINDVKRYGEFSDFASSFLIENWNPERDAVAREYQAKLSDTRLNPVDRARLEGEFQNKIKALNIPEYRLSFRRRASLVHMPRTLVAKILDDTLKTWAQFAAERKGALLHNVPVIGRSVLQWEQIATQEYLIGVDMLRTHIARVLENIDVLRKLPGADTVRGGPNQLTLAEVKASLEDVMQFELEPLAAMANSGVSKQLEVVRQYVDNQLVLVRLKRDEANRRAAGLEQSLQQYVLQSAGVSVTASQNVPIPGVQRPQAAAETPALIPQFSESFLDRIMQISSRAEDIAYRQRLTNDLIGERFLTAKLDRELAYYDALSRRLAGARGSAGRSDQAARLERQLKAAFDHAGLLVDHVVALYQEISKNSLNPGTMLYTVTVPYSVQRTSPFTTNRVLLGGVVTMMLAFGLLLMGVMARERSRVGEAAEEGQPVARVPRGVDEERKSA